MKTKLVAIVAGLLMLASFKPEGGLKVGDKAADFKLKNIDGKEVSLSGNFKSDKGVIVVFTCNH